MERFPLGKEEERDIISGLRVRRLSVLPDINLSLPYFTNNPFPKPDQILMQGERLDATEGKLCPRALYLADLTENEVRRVSPFVEGACGWRSWHGLAAARDGKRAFWLVDRVVFAVDLEREELREIYRCPDGWDMGQCNCTAAGDVYSIGLTRSDFKPSSSRSADSEARAFPQPVGRIVLVDTETGRADIVHETRGVPSHTNVNPYDKNTVMFCHEGHASYVENRIWLLDVNKGEAVRACVPPPGTAIGHEAWTEDDRIIYHGSTLCLLPQDCQPGRREPIRSFFGVGRKDGTVERICWGSQITNESHEGGAWAHVSMSPDGKWVTTGGHWGRSHVWKAKWGEADLKPILVCAHHTKRSSPRFFSDSRSILFNGQRGLNTGQVFKVDLEG